MAVTTGDGVELGIAELGSLLSSTDSTGQGRATWLTQVGQYLRERDAAFVAYFDTNGKGTDYRLLDKPSIDAWRLLVSGTTAPSRGGGRSDPDRAAAAPLGQAADQQQADAGQAAQDGAARPQRALADVLEHRGAGQRRHQRRQA